MGGHRTQWLVAFATYLLNSFRRRFVTAFPTCSKSGREQPIALDRSRESPGVVKSTVRFGTVKESRTFPRVTPEKSIRRENP